MIQLPQYNWRCLVRVTSGVARGIMLETINSIATRPTLDKVKQAIFNTIQFEVPKSDVLDLFAGSGALGIEALSRGANSAVFVDNSTDCVRIIGKNLEKAKLHGEVVKTDWESYLKACVKNKKAFDIIFLDPPYDAQTLNNVLAYVAENKQLLNEDAKIICEYRQGYILNTGEFAIAKQAKYGQVGVCVLKN
jgi:16S rRNA (guanine(966)-N(2))-methyltransferase RsmD